MCVIVYKPIGKRLPSKSILKKCFERNPDGAGYMLPLNDKVVIHKGFMTFNDFKKDIERFIKDNKINVVETPIVLHFRITTQGGVQAELCHPYPICRDYDEMRKLETTADMALCHNGIISSCSTSEYSLGHWDYKLKKWVNGVKQALNYNDTMTFIKDYASLVIDNDKYFALNDNKCELLERLCEYSRLAIMNNVGYVKLIGQFYEKDGIYYSNLFHFETPKKEEPATSTYDKYFSTGYSNSRYYPDEYDDDDRF